MRSRPYQICSRCIMDTTDPGISFDASGVCCYCRIYDRRVKNEVFRAAEGEERLNAVVARMKQAGRGKRYDCLLGISGGVDSTMALWVLKQRGLRVLAIHLDNGWNSELAVDNIKKVLEKLDVDLQTHVLDWEEFRDLQLAFLKASVPNAEIPTDHAIVALHFKVAREQGIRYIINGGNVATEAFVPTAWAYDARDLRHIKAIHRRFGSVPLRTFPMLGIAGSLWAVLGRGIKWIGILNYIDYDKARAIEMLQNELGWRPYGAKHYESLYTRFYQAYILRRKFGYDKRRAHLSNLVLAGEIIREQAIAEIEQDDYVGSPLYLQDREFVIKKLGLTESGFEAVMALPPRKHYEYPNHRLILEKVPHLLAGFRRLAANI
jgi:N-acetyl sugar amidotransferase